MRRLLAVLAAFLLLVTAGAAITIETPESRVYLEEAISITVSGASGAVDYSLNGGQNRTCNCSDSGKAIIAPDGENVLRVYDTGDGIATDRRTFTVDTSPPNITARSPTGTLYTRPQQLRLGYTDVSSIATADVTVTLDGAPLNGSAGQDAFTASVANISEGRHTVSFTVPDEHADGGGAHTANGAWNVTLPVAPAVSGTAPTGPVGRSPKISATARDPAGIDLDTSYINVSGPEDRQLGWDGIGNGSAAVTPQVAFARRVNGLADGTYAATAHVEDGKGNVAERSWTFTVDTAPPNLSVPSHTTGDVVTGNESFRFNVSDRTTVAAVNLTVEGRTVTATPDGPVHTATVDTARLKEGDTTITVRAADSRGNTVSEQVTVTVDNSDPVISNVDIYPRTADGGISISAVVQDAATIVRGARYEIERLGSDTVLKEGRLNAVVGEYDAKQEKVARTVDLDGLNLTNGTYTALLSARDSADHETTGVGEMFEVDRDRTAALTIQDTTLQQEIGTTAEFDIGVANTGAVDELVHVEATSDIDTAVRPERKRIGTGETKQFILEATLPDSQAALGNHTVTITAEGLSTTTTTTLSLGGQPHPPAREEIRTEFEQLQEQLEELNESRQQWAFGGEVEDGFEKTAQRASEVEQLLDAGKYTQAREKLDAAQTTLDQTESTFSGQVTRARMRNLGSALLKLLALLAVTGLAYGGYRLIPAEKGYTPGQGYVHRPGGKHPLRLRLERAWHRVRARAEDRPSDESERAVDGWNGYRD